MANDIKLQSEAGTHPLDENLRPLKIGNSTSPLELSNTDVKVNNLVVGGTTTGISASDDTKLPLAGGTMTGDITTDSNIVHTGSSLHIDASGDILISAAGDDISFSSDGIGERFITLSHATGSGNFIQTFAPDSVTSYSSYLVAANSATVISTSDADGSAGHFTLNIDGDIILDAVTGITKFYLAGDTDDLCTLTVAANGVTTIATTDSDGAVGHLTLDIDGDVILDPVSGITKFYLAGDTDDLCTLTVAANGATTITTADSDGTAGDLRLDIDGGITLDPATGAFVSKNNGTEFSVANSAYAGMILGYTTVGIDAAADSYTLTPSFAVTDSAHKVKFVAPPSGVVEIFVSIYGDFFRRITYLGLSDNATYNALDATHEHIVSLPPTASGDRVINHRWVITGLTAGTAYEYWLGAKSTHGLAILLRWGGDATEEYAPFIMKATALPTAVADYAVYG